MFTQCVRLGGKAVSINEFQKTKWFDKSRHLNYRDTGISVREVLAVPMFDVNGSILGVLEVINKKNEGLGFNQKDLRMLTAVTSHISLTVQGPGSSLRYECTLRVRFQIIEPSVFVLPCFSYNISFYKIQSGKFFEWSRHNVTVPTWS